MNYYQPREKLDAEGKRTGRFDYTCQNGSGERARIYPVGYCLAWKPWTAEGVRHIHLILTDEDAQKMAGLWNQAEAPYLAHYHSDGHATEAEAVACYRRYQLDRELKFYPDLERPEQLERCKAPGCDTFTSGSAFLNHFKRWALCATHRTREVVEQLYKPGGWSAGS